MMPGLLKYTGRGGGGTPVAALTMRPVGEVTMADDTLPARGTRGKTRYVLATCALCGKQRYADPRYADRPCWPCAQRRRGKHLASDHPLYTRWKAMIDRCINPECKHYGNYGGRG